MKKEDKEWIIKRYSERSIAENFADGSLRSGPQHRRQIRFQNLIQIGIKDGDSILDVGCGYGDFVGHLKERKINIKYEGVDINPIMISEAKRRYPNEFFRVLDIVNDSYEKYDWIVSTSCFNLKLKSQDNYEFTKQILKSAYLHSKKGVAFDFLSTYVDFTSEFGFHYSPEKVFSIAKEITKCVSLRHDYPIYEFCIYLYPDFKGWIGEKK